MAANVTTDERTAAPPMAAWEIEPDSGRETLPARVPEQQPRPARATVVDDRPALGRAMVASEPRVLVRWSEQCGQLVEALAAAMSEEGYGDISKTKTARVTKRDNPGQVLYTFDYETLNDVLLATRPYLAKHGLVFMQFPFTVAEGGKQGITIRSEIRHKSGEYVYSDLYAVLVEGLSPQPVGSGITFLKRYAAKSILAVSADDEDDDGTAASGNSANIRRRDDSDQRREQPVQPAPRRSQQRDEGARPQAAPATPAEQRKPAAEAPRDDVALRTGKVAKVSQSADAHVVTLSTGYMAATRDPEIQRALGVYESTGATIELTTRPPAGDPRRFLPTIVEATIRHASRAGAPDTAQHEGGGQ